MNNIYGIHSIIEAIEANQNISKVFLLKDLKSNLSFHLKRILKEKEIPISYVPKEKLNRLSTKNHQGAVAIIAPIKFTDLDTLLLEKKDKKKQLYLILEGITDTRNLGAITRTANAAHIDGIILAKTGNALINDDTVKASSGAIFNVPICRVDHLKDAIYLLQSYKIEIIATSEKFSDSIYDVDFQNSVSIIVGSEEKGISSGLLKLIKKKVKIPMLGKIKSLNVSVATGIILYEIVRQQNFTKNIFQKN